MPFERISFGNKDIIGVKAVGEITRKDYIKEIYPLLEQGRRKGHKTAFYIEFGKSFKSYSLDGLWEDARFGLKYLKRISKLAVVTDLGFVRSAALFVGSLIPCPVKVFNTGQAESAKAWLEFGRAGINFELNSEEGVLYLHLHSALESEDFQALSNDVDEHIEKRGKLKGIVIEAEKFPGWKNFGSIVSHFEFVKSHHRLVEKVALVTDDSMASLVRPLADHFTKAKIRRFESSQYDRALRWIKGSQASTVSSPDERDHQEPLRQ